MLKRDAVVADSNIQTIKTLLYSIDVNATFDLKQFSSSWYMRSNLHTVLLSLLEHKFFKGEGERYEPICQSRC